MKLIAVYGSLRFGYNNHIILAAGNARLVSTETINIPYGMISYGGFPALVPSDNYHDIVVEIYECDERTYARVERLEGYPSFYQKDKITTSAGEVEFYVINDENKYEDQPAHLQVTNGNWLSHREATITDYTNYI